MNTQEDKNYREWLVERLEGFTGTLDGEGKGLFSLNTTSLEKLYKEIVEKNPAEEWKKELEKFARHVRY